MSTGDMNKAKRGIVPTLTNDPHIQLAFSIHESSGVYAILVGSGLSRAAEIPTGWEITLDLIRRVGQIQGAGEQTDWAAWHREATGTEPNYSTLLEGLGTSPEERRSILHGYIEPTEQDREDGRKVPTVAHRAIADLVRDAHIRVIITTNFDRLIENALRDVGIEPTVVASPDALLGAEPITHSACYILKLHGDYKDARILNTEAELSVYPPEYDRLLDRVLDEHGLVVCGWSGEWDHALRNALLRAPNRRYPIFWTARGTPGEGARGLITNRSARVLDITDADTFFSVLNQRVKTLEQTRQQNPRSVELLVNSVKRFLSKQEHRIQLDELLAQETDRLLTSVDNESFSPAIPWEKSRFQTRVTEYESLTESLACIAGVLGRWGDGSELSSVLDIMGSLRGHARKIGSGLNAYLDLRMYPAALIFTAYGIGLTRAERWKTLHTLCATPVEHDYREPERMVRTLFLNAWASKEIWQNIAGFERRKTPASDHLLTVFETWGKRFAALVPDFTKMYERFELLCSVAALEVESKSTLSSTLSNNLGNGFVWMPVGRVGWDSAKSSALVLEFRSEPRKSMLLEAGFANGDADFLDLSLTNFERVANRIQW